MDNPFAQKIVFFGSNYWISDRYAEVTEYFQPVINEMFYGNSGGKIITNEGTRFLFTSLNEASTRGHKGDFAIVPKARMFEGYYCNLIYNFRRVYMIDNFNDLIAGTWDYAQKWIGNGADAVQDEDFWQQLDFFEKI